MDIIDIIYSKGVDYMKHNAEVIAKVINYIEEHLADELDLEKIASAAGYSKYHLHRMFAEGVGCTVHQYIQKRRLTEAARQLVHTDKPIINIAFSAGYEAQQSFTLAFKKLYLVSPQVYRKQKEFFPIQLKVQQVKGAYTSYIRMSNRCGVRAA